MTIKAEIQSLSPSALIELFVLDYSNLPGGTILRFHAGTNGLNNAVVWQGNTYAPLPVKAEGFNVTTKGAPPRPKLTVANAMGLLSAEVRNFNDFVGCKVTRKRTFTKYLDAVNFPGGVNPDANPFQCLPDELWFVERKLNENRYVIEFELSSALDVQGVMLPSRQIIQNACSWKYRDANCGYHGGYFDKDDLPTDQAHDYCSKTLAACKVRFSSQLQLLRFGGFPGAQRGTQ